MEQSQEQFPKQSLTIPLLHSNLKNQDENHQFKTQKQNSALSTTKNYPGKENTNNLLWKGRMLSPGNFHTRNNQKKKEKTIGKGRDLKRIHQRQKTPQKMVNFKKRKAGGLEK